jgi:purine-binding chemotaxis protein CheW
VAELPALVVPVGLDLYAVPMSSVREVVAAPSLTPLLTAPASVLGLFNLRGEVVPLFDTAALVGMGRLTAWPFAVVLKTPLGPAGLAASALPDSVVFGEQVGPSESPGTVGAYSAGGRLVVLIDVDALLAPARIGGGGHLIGVAETGHSDDHP